MLRFPGIAFLSFQFEIGILSRWCRSVCYFPTGPVHPVGHLFFFPQGGFLPASLVRNLPVWRQGLELLHRVGRMDARIQTDARRIEYDRLQRGRDNVEGLQEQVDAAEERSLQQLQVALGHL